MKLNYLYINFVFLPVLYCCQCPEENYPEAERVVMIALDGISVRGFEEADTPNIDDLLADGALSKHTRAVMPSVTLPNWTSHLTGSGPEQHGVTDNAWTIDSKILPPAETDEDGYYPSLWQKLRENVPDVRLAFYYNWKELINSMNRKYLDEVGFEENGGYMHNYREALEFLVENKDRPTVVFLYSVHTDHAGHNHKWMSDEYIRSIEDADRVIGDFIREMKAAGLYDSTHFMFLSDHGGTGYGHGGISPDEIIVPWGITGPGIRSGYEMPGPNNTVNTAPLVLSLFGVPVPDVWVGKVPESIFAR